MRLILIVTGFLKRHKRKTGLIALYEELKVKYPDDVVKLYYWGDIGEILRDLVHYRSKKIYAVGHSYGVSTLLFAFTLLYKRLPHIKIEYLLSIDGVWRPTPEDPSLKSVRPDHALEAPENIKEIYAFKQKRGVIQGHDFKFGNDTTYSEEILTGVRHPWLDQHKRVREKALEIF